MISNGVTVYDTYMYRDVDRNRKRWSGCIALRINYRMIVHDHDVLREKLWTVGRWNCFNFPKCLARSIAIRKRRWFLFNPADDPKRRECSPCVVYIRGMCSREDSGGGGGSSRGVSGDYYRLTQAIKYILIRAHCAR